MKSHQNRRQFVGSAIATAAALGTGANALAGAAPRNRNRLYQASPYPESNLQSEKTLTIGQEVNPTTLNLALSTNASFQNISGQVVEQLVRFSADGATIEPWLAEEFSWIDDTTLELKIRQGISFSNGEPLDATAVKFSIDEFAAATPYQTYLLPDIYDNTEIVDDATVHVHLTAAFSPFTGFLARGGAVFPPVYYQEIGAEEFGMKPIGTGPFTMEEWAADSYIRLARNDAYWNGPHPLKTVTFSIIPENTARLAALEAQEIDLTTVPIEALDTLANSSTNTAVTVPGLRKYAMFFDTKSGLTPELSDVRVRQALNHAVDKQAIVDMVYLGYASPLQGQWLSEQEVGFNPELSMFEYDPDLAKSLLAEAGYPDGFTMQFTYRSPVHKELGEIVSSYLQQVGITVNQRGLEAGAFVAAQGDLTIGPHQQGLLLPPNPFYNLNLFAHGGKYEWHILSDEYTDLVYQGVVTLDEEEQLGYYHQAAEVAYNDPPALYLIMPHDTYGVGNRVNGFTPRLDQVIDLYNVDVTE